MGMGIVSPLIATYDEDVVSYILEGTEGVMEDGLATDFEKLFGKLGAATIAAASCKDEGDNGCWSGGGDWRAIGHRKKGWL